MSREQRKLDHIKYALKLGDGPLTNGLENVHFVHNCLPELNPQDIVLSSQFGGIFFLSPFLINAVTGGAERKLTGGLRVRQKKLVQQSR